MNNVIQNVCCPLPEFDEFDIFFSNSITPFHIEDGNENEIFISSSCDSTSPQVDSVVCLPTEVKEDEDSATAEEMSTINQCGGGLPQSPSQSMQSKLHNCPKHLVKFLAQALDLNRLDKLDYREAFGEISSEVRAAIKGLLDLLYMSHKGKIRSTSKELLKIVFETHSEKNNKFRLLQNNRIRNYFEAHKSDAVNQAKSILRRFAMDRLLLRKDTFLDESRILRKDINEKYLELFIQELREDHVKQRISKSDKLKIFEACENF